MKLFANRPLAVALLVALALAACVRGERSPCPKFVKDLASPVKAKDALREIGDQKCKMAIPKLEEMFDQDKYRDEVIRTVQKIGWHPGVIKGEVNEHEKAWAIQSLTVLRKGLTDRNTAGLASAIIQDWHVTDAKDDLIKVLENPEFVKARNQALQALVSVVGPKEKGRTEDVESLKSLEDIFLKLLDGDANSQELVVNVTAAQKLGVIRSNRAIDSLINTMFLRTLKEERMYQVARRSLLQIGTPALDRLLETLDGKNATLTAYTQANNILDWEWADSPMLVQTIGDFLDPKSAVPLITKQAMPLNVPAGLSDKQIEMWKMNQINRIKVTMLGLAAIGSDEILPKAKEVIATTDADIQQRLDTATAVALVGSPAAIDTLLELFKAEKDDNFRAPLQVPIALALDAAHLEAWTKLKAADKAEVTKTFLDQNPDVITHFGLVEKCKDDLACWKEQLESVDPVVASKAALAIRQLGDKSKDTIDRLFKRFKKAKGAETDLRRFIVLAMLRLSAGEEYTFAKLVDLWRNEADLGTAASKFWAGELEMSVWAWRARYGFDPDTIGASAPVKGPEGEPKAEEAKPADAPAPAPAAAPAPEAKPAQ